ncbi:MAG: threonine synthase [Acidimicrobiia bacterium]
MIPTPGLDHVLRLECLVCGNRYDPAEIDYVCPDHGAVGTLDVVYDYELVGRRLRRARLRDDPERTMWRYRPLLPIDPETAVPPLAVGWTPLYRADRLRAELGLRRLWVKDDGRQPTASLKDRASAVAVVKARERRAEIVTTASTGNAAAALSGLCASVGQPNVIFVPETAPEAKVAQLLAFGSTVLLVQASYDEAFDLCMAAADRFGWYNRNTGVNPYMTEGKKTAMLEIFEQLEGNLPDVVLVGVGDGCIIGGLHKGLRDLATLGWIDRMPRLVGVQAEGSSFFVQAWEQGEDILTKPPAPADTVADSIAAGLPRDRIKAMRAVGETGGEFLAVADEQILAAIPALARGCGVFAEPAAAAAYAGLVEAIDRGLVGADESVLVLSTGSGLKDVPAAMRAVEAKGTVPRRVAPDLADVERALADENVPSGN